MPMNYARHSIEERGGDYVYPVQATVLALTEKRVKIEADEDGERVICYVPPQSLQRQG
jgi:hypothetical protein